MNRTTVYSILFLISAVHLLNDTFQALIPAIYPILQQSMALSNTEIGLIGFALNMTASVMQPAVGLYTDRKPQPYALPFGMLSTLIGIIGLAFAPSLPWVLASVLCIGVGSAVFHPESSRVVNLAAGEKRGLAQSIFQVGGNAGQALAPVLTALIFVPFGQTGAVVFAAVALIGVIALTRVAGWYRVALAARETHKKNMRVTSLQPHISRKLYIALALIVLFVFARSFYYTGIASFYPLYLLDTYDISISKVQLYSFLFLAAGALSTFLGGPISDRFGRKNVIVFSMVGALPLAFLLPMADLSWSLPLCFLLGFITLASFSVTVVYAQDLFPNSIGTMSGLVVGFAFGMGAISSLLFGIVADAYSLALVMQWCSWLPLLGSVALFLPSDRTLRSWHQPQ
jgi:FSR family fosmidomycin resistance protein-like MFS transporter